MATHALRPPTIQKAEVFAEDDRLDYLTESEVNHLLVTSRNGSHDLFRRCCLGILHSGAEIDNTKELLALHSDFDVEIERWEQGVKFVLQNAPMSAFIEGEMKTSLVAHICSAAIDLIYHAKHQSDPETSEVITEKVFHVLRHADLFEQRASVHKGSRDKRVELSRVVCWGGHSIPDEEYKYCKEVGRHLAERGAELITGCGPGAMKGPFSGARAGYAAQRVNGARYFGFTCPSIVTSEPPNSHVDPLITLPDIEKRLEAFIRASLGCVIFAGGPGTAEEIQTILSILLHPLNNNQQYPVVLTGPESVRGYFHAIKSFLEQILGDQVFSCNRPKLEIIVNDAVGVAKTMMSKIQRARQSRIANEDSSLWFRSLHIPFEVQKPFDATHDNVRKLSLHRDQEPYQIAAQMRRLFSAVVHGNVSDAGNRAIEENGPFEVRGDPAVIGQLDTLLQRFVKEGRMKIHGEYKPCYTLKAES